MASSYPGSLDNLAADKANADDLVDDHPGHHNDLADAINAVQTELGTDPAGSVQSTVVARLNATDPQVTILVNLTQSVGTGTNTATAFASEVRDDGGWHDNATNNSRVTPGVAGDYRVSMSATWDGNNSGSRLMWVYVNGSVIVAGEKDPTGAANTMQSCSQVVALGASDYVEAYTFQDSGGTRSVTVRFTVERVPAAQT